MKSESLSKTTLILFSLALIPCLWIGHRQIVTHSVNEAALITQAENFCQAIVSAESPPATFDDYFEFLGEHPRQFRNTIYGEAQQPGDIGYQPLMDDEGIIGFRVTVYGNRSIVYNRSLDF